MKKCKCKGSCKLGKLFGKLIGIALLANVALFVVFFFDLDGKFFFYIYEPFFKNHYDNMARRDMTQMPYDMDKYPAYKYDEV